MTARDVDFRATMTHQQLSSLDETLTSLQADREARQFDGVRFENAVLRHAKDIPGWEVANCWRYLEWPDRITVGVPLPSQDAGIDLVAVKRDGSRIAIQCKARSGDGSVTTKQVQQLAGAAPSPVFAERWFVAEAHRSAATEGAATVADVTFVDFEAALADAREAARERESSELDPRTAMQQEAVAECVKALRAGLPEYIGNAGSATIRQTGCRARRRERRSCSRAAPARPACRCRSCRSCPNPVTSAWCSFPASR